MKDNWEDILGKHTQLDPQKLMDYLEGKLDDREKHEVESMLADSAFMDDALEGLGQVKDKQKIAVILHELNTQLKKNAKARNHRTTLHQLRFPGWLLFATVTIILLILLAYIIYKMYTTPAG
jgi:anti-sigma factor RsiW